MRKSKAKLKPKKKISSTIKCMFLIMLLVGAIVAFLLSPVFNIRDIVVVGNNKILTDKIINISELNINQNIFKFFKPNVINKIKENSYIDQVKIKRELPNKVVIDIVERVPTYVLEVGTMYAYISNQGYVLELLDENLELPSISGYSTNEIIPGNRLNVEDLASLEKIIEIMNVAKNNDISDQIIGFIIEGNRLVLKFHNNKVAYIRDMANINIKIVSLRAILERERNKAGEIFLDGIIEGDTPIFREEVKK